MILRTLNRSLARFGYELRRKPYDGVTEAWPGPEAAQVDIPALLLLTLPFSGSTAMARLLCQTGEIAGLHQAGEGQWLVRGMCSEDRWLPEKYIHYPSVAGAWSRRLDDLRTEHPKLRYLIEKSPPNMVRFSAIAALFPEHRTVANNRNPFAAVASVSGRKWSDARSSHDGDTGLRMATHDWITRSRCLRDLCQTHDIPLVTYETFCADPLSVARAFRLDDIDLKTDVDVSVKDYAEGGIQNMNARQIDRLSPRDRDIIAEMLAPETELLRYFGYSATP